MCARTRDESCFAVTYVSDNARMIWLYCYWCRVVLSNAIRWPPVTFSFYHVTLCGKVNKRKKKTELNFEKRLSACRHTIDIDNYYTIFDYGRDFPITKTEKIRRERRDVCRFFVFETSDSCTDRVRGPFSAFLPVAQHIGEWNLRIFLVINNITLLRREYVFKVIDLWYVSYRIGTWSNITLRPT